MWTFRIVPEVCSNGRTGRSRQEGSLRLCSAIVDDYSRFIVAWKLCTTIRAGDMTDTLRLALAASGRDTPKVLHGSARFRSAR
jgi:transposase InsO family protein